MDNPKLVTLAEVEGMDVMEMLEEAVVDSVAPGICMNPGCSYTTQVEPDSDSGWCEECSTNSVKSCLMIAGIM